ncbi:MAG: DUF3604 domain-containing protein [Planctomycetota bacterium]|nr:MAG: DUF3604 domain-containing protein [Planctomycetota bacterium]
MRSAVVLALALGFFAWGWARLRAPDPAEVADLGRLGSATEPATEPCLRLRDGAPELVCRLGEAWKVLSVSADGVAQTGAASEAVPAWLDLERLTQASAGMAASWREGELRASGQHLGWCPSPAHDATGAPHLAYDTYRGGSYDVIYRDPAGQETTVAGTSRAEFHPSLALDADGRVWLAWEEAEENWGREGILHGTREMRLAVREGSGWKQVALPADLRGAEGLGAERPQVAADRGGLIWMFWRVQLRLRDVGGFGGRRVAWRIHCSALGADGWTAPVALPHSEGPNHDGLALLPLPGGGILAAYETDGRWERFRQVRSWPETVSAASQVQVARVRAPGGAPRVEGPALPAAESAAAGAGAEPGSELVPEGFVRLWGDLHRHSDLSRCSANLDGSVVDQYRYARDVAQLDFLALTDHFQHLTPPLWSWQLRVAQRLNAPGVFTTLFGFERAFANGHRNVIGIDAEDAADAPFRAVDTGAPEKSFDPEHWVVVPHQLADPGAVLDWSAYSTALETAVEVYQGRRGSYESLDGPRRALEIEDGAPFAVDYLKMGRRFGLIASSDHASVSSAFTAVLARENTRAAILEALHARRCYAATARMNLDLRLGGLLMGEAGAVEPEAALQVRVGAGSPIARVEVVRNGAVAQVWTGNTHGTALVELRLGRDAKRHALEVGIEDAEIAGLIAMDLESDDRLRRVSDTQVRVDVQLNATDEDGLILELRVEPGATLTLSEEQPVVTMVLDDLRTQGPRRFQFRGAAGEARWSPPPLRTAVFDERWQPGDWKPGDWAYVRVVRLDGEVAWSSPIWVAR